MQQTQPKHGLSQPPRPQSPEWERVRATFKRIWGYDNFRPPQGDIVHSLLDQRDALIVMPTGGGKSICFQLPALMQRGLTLVVSPLVALMENQVAELRQRQLPAASLHSELPASQKRKTLWQLEKQQLRLLYLSPETLLSPKIWAYLSEPSLTINGLILDEAHCLVQWGDTFRPAYRRLGAVRPALLKTKPPGSTMAIAAFTATADPQAQRTITQTLQLQNPVPFLLNPYRPNIALGVETVWTPRGRRTRLLRCIQSHRKEAGLVYVRTRKDSVALAQWLTEQGYRTAAYHAGLGAEQRRAIEHRWLTGDILFVVCTSAFGMGINHPHVRWVVHFQVPLLLSEYVQEVGRAGRDGKAAIALSLISEPTGWLDPDDRQRQTYFQQQLHTQHQKALRLAKQLPLEGEVMAVAKEFKDGAISQREGFANALSMLHSMGKLDWVDPFHYRIRAQGNQTASASLDRAAQQMMNYLHTKDCRWQFVLRAFGFTKDAEGMRCRTCDRCVGRSSQP